MDKFLRASGASRLELACFVAAVGLLAIVWYVFLQQSDGAAAAIDPAVRADFQEPIVLESEDSVLEVRLTARQGKATLDTVEKPVENFLLFSWEVIQGSASNGETSGEDTYPAPTLQVYPGDKLIVHLDNAMAGLTIRDYYNPKFSGKDEKVPLYPEQLTQAPINLHTHGLRISPKGNSDNVLLHVSAGLSNTYTYDIRPDHPHGAYWYHPHLHGLTSPQVYMGLAGVLAIGRLDGNIPLVTDNELPIRNMVLQYNYVFDRKGGLAQLNNTNWPQYVSTLTPPKEDELAKGTYRPLLTPVNFSDSEVGTKAFTVWYAGSLGLYNNRGFFQYIPANLQSFRSHSEDRSKDIPADPSLPDYQRDIQFTVNGQFQPNIKSKAGQTEIWVLSNISDMAYMTVQLTETATGNHPRIPILGEDGNPGSAVRYSPLDDGRKLIIPPATRYVIAVTIPEEGELILEMPPLGEGATAFSENGILYTNNGTENPPAILGSLTVLPSAVSYNDGFFVFPTQVLATVMPSGERGVATEFAEGQALNAPDTGFEDLSKVTPDFTRKIDVTGGFLNDLANPDDPKTFVYAFNGAGFPNAPLLQPRLGSVEEWQFYNYNNDEHPIHIHVNDFQVTRFFDPTTGLEIGAGKWEADTANLAQPTQVADQNEDVAQPAELFLRSRFENYIGTFVMHCHRLNHEDNGLMTMVNIIPAVSSYAVAVPGSRDNPATVSVYDGNGDKLIATVTPFSGYQGVLTVAMGDVDGDSVYDLIVGAGKDHAPEVVVYSGKGGETTGAFETELVRFTAFASSANGGISVTASSVDGRTSDNIIVGSGPGIPSEVKVFAYEAGAAALFSSFSPYGDDTAGVNVASGLVSFASGRNSIVTAPGPGSPSKVKVFDYWLMKPTGLKMSETSVPLQLCSGSASQPAKIAEFAPFGEDYTGGVSLTTGWLYGELGGAKRIVVGQMAGSGMVKVFSAGSALQGGPEIYLEGPVEHGTPGDYIEEASFAPFAGSSGLRVATTSTTTGADLLVSGFSTIDSTAMVRKYAFIRPDDKATTVQPRLLNEVFSANVSTPLALGGD